VGKLMNQSRTGARRSPNPAELAAWREYVETAEAIRQALASGLQSTSGVSPGDYAVLLALSEADEHRLRSSILAEKLGWERSRLSHPVAWKPAGSFVGTVRVLTAEVQRLSLPTREPGLSAAHQHHTSALSTGSSLRHCRPRNSKPPMGSRPVCAATCSRSPRSQMEARSMSNLGKVPEEIICTEGGRTAAVELLSPREVPLGGPRARTARWTLPQKQRSLIGAWFSWTTRSTNHGLLVRAYQDDGRHRLGLPLRTWVQRRFESQALDPAIRRPQYPEGGCAARGRHHLSPGDEPRVTRIFSS
jgi:hypothetical protein